MEGAWEGTTVGHRPSVGGTNPITDGVQPSENRLYKELIHIKELMHIYFKQNFKHHGEYKSKLPGTRQIRH